MDCSACHNRVCLLCLKLNGIKNKGKPHQMDYPINTHHCSEHCLHEDERSLLPEVILLDERWRMK